MTRRVLGSLAWLASSALLLCVGVIGSMYAAIRLARGDPDALRKTQFALVVYTQVVLLKGLLPQLLLAWAVWPLVERSFSLRSRGRRAVALGLVAAAALASLPAAALLLPAPLFGLSPVRYSGALNLLETCAEMTLAVALALAIPRLLVAPRETRPALHAGAARVALTVLAALAFGALGIGLASLGAATREPPRGAQATPPAVPAEPPAAPAVPERAPAADDAAELPATSLPLHLLWTRVDALQSQSLALVFDRDGRATQSLHEGDRFERHPQAALARIEIDRVLIDNDGRLEELRVEADIPGLLGALAPAEATGPEAAERRRQMVESLRERIAAERDGTREVGAEPVRGGLLADGDARPVYRDGVLEGFAFENLEPGGFFDRMGLRDGDLVSALNGIPLRDLGGAELLAQVVAAPRFELAVERPDGTRESLSLPTAELLGRLAAVESGP